MFGLRRWIRGRPWWQRITLGVLLSFVMFVVSRWLWWEYTYAKGEKELAAAIAETEAQDPRWRWEQLEADQEQVPDAENSILIVKKVEASLNHRQLGSLKSSDGKTLLPEVIDNHRLDSDGLATLATDVKDHELTFKLALSLKDFPRGRAQIRLETNVLNTSLAHAQACRTPAGILALDIERLLHERDVDSTWDRVQAILHAGAALRDEPTLISQLVRIALRVIAVRRLERILAMGQPKSIDLKAISTHLASEEKEELFIPALRGERAMFTTFFENLISGRLTVNDLTALGNKSAIWEENVGWKLYKARLPADRAYHLRTMNELIMIARAPIQERMRRLEVFNDRFRRSVTQAREDKEHLITTFMLPAVDKVGEASVRDKALLRCALTALAAERYRIDKEHWPKSLNDLSPKYLDAVLVDPFDGSPLKLSIRDDGITIYSVGADGLDNGGTNLTPTGKEQGADLGFRLWNVDQRGLPAVSKPKDENQP